MKVVRSSASCTGRLYPQESFWYSFSLGAESTPQPWCGRKEYVTEKSSDTTGTVRLVAQHLNHYATPGPTVPLVLSIKVIIPNKLQRSLKLLILRPGLYIYIYIYIYMCVLTECSNSKYISNSQNVQCVTLATEHGIEDIATKFKQEYVRCVRNEEECVCGVCL